MRRAGVTAPQTAEQPGACPAAPTPLGPSALLTLLLQWLQLLLLLFFILESGPPSWQEQAQSLAPSGHSAS